MKTKVIVLLCLFAITVLFLSHNYSSAQMSSPISKIGVIDIVRISKECQATLDYIKKADAEFKNLKKEEQELYKDLQDLQAEIESGAFREGSNDYIARRREFELKRSQLETLSEVNQQEQVLKDQIWQLELYQKILKVTKEVGKAKELYLVLSDTEPDFEEQGIEELQGILMTHKVLYSDGCVDITDDVIARLNQEN